VQQQQKLSANARQTRKKQLALNFHKKFNATLRQQPTTICNKVRAAKCVTVLQIKPNGALSRMLTSNGGYPGKRTTEA